MGLIFEYGLTDKELAVDIDKIVCNLNAIENCTIFGNISEVITQSKGILLSKINGNVYSIESRMEGVFQSHITGNIEKINSKLGWAISDSEIKGAVGDINALNGIRRSTCGSIGNVQTKDHSCLNESVVEYDVGDLISGRYGLVDSIIFGNVGEVKSNVTGIHNSNICGNVKKISSRIGVYTSTVKGFIEGIECKDRFMDPTIAFYQSGFNLVVGNIKADVLDEKCHFANLVIGDKIEVGRHKNTVNVIVPNRTDDFIYYTGNFEELKEYARNNPKKLIGLRCLKTDVKRVLHLTHLLEIEQELEKKLETDNLDYVQFISSSLPTDSHPLPKNFNVIKRIKKYSVVQEILTHTELTTGGRQLLASRINRLNVRGWCYEDITKEINRLYCELKNLETSLKETPTFGCELCVNLEDIKEHELKYDAAESISLANELLKLGGNKKIRLCSLDQNTVEFRINPSYAPITAALANELFELGILPKDLMIGYLVNIVGERVLENGLPLICINYFTGLSSAAPNEGGSAEELTFRDVHVYHGATVDVKTGLLQRETPQLNIFAGVAGRVENRGALYFYKAELENDVNERYKRMLMPFLVSEKYREEWRNGVFDAVGINEEQAEKLQKKLHDAEGEQKLWRTKNDLRVIMSKDTELQLREVYRVLEEKVLEEKPELYFQLANIKL